MNQADVHLDGVIHAAEGQLDLPALKQSQVLAERGSCRSSFVEFHC